MHNAIPHDSAVLQQTAHARVCNAGRWPCQWPLPVEPGRGAHAPARSSQTPSLFSGFPTLLRSLPEGQTLAHERHRLCRSPLRSNLQHPPPTRADRTRPESSHHASPVHHRRRRPRRMLHLETRHRRNRAEERSGTHRIDPGGGAGPECRCQRLRRPGRRPPIGPAGRWRTRQRPGEPGIPRPQSGGGLTRRHGPGGPGAQQAARRRG